jgi:hypothetical protein
VIALVLLALIGAPPASAETTELWAGRAMMTGHRSVPFLGKVEAKTDSFVLAKVVRKGNTITFDQINCKLDLMNPIGVILTLNPGAAEKIPPVHLVFEKRPDGWWHQHETTTGWDKEDVDGDGHPGLTINVEAPVCGGKLFVGLHTTSIARGTLTPEGGMKGQLKAKGKQAVIDTEGACLSVLVRDSDESAAGTFAYVPVPKDSTCASLSKEAWPLAKGD